MAVAYIINIPPSHPTPSFFFFFFFPFFWPADHKAFLTAQRLVKYVLRAGKFLQDLFLDARSLFFSSSRNPSITSTWGAGGGGVLKGAPDNPPHPLPPPPPPHTHTHTHPTMLWGGGALVRFFVCASHAAGSSISPVSPLAFQLSFDAGEKKR